MKQMTLKLAVMCSFIMGVTLTSFGQYNTNNSTDAIPVTTDVFDAAKLEAEMMHVKYTNELHLTAEQEKSLEGVNKRYLDEIADLQIQDLPKSQYRQKKMYAHHKRLFRIKSFLTRDQAVHFKRLIKTDMGGGVK